MKKLLMFVFIGTAICLYLVGCGQHADHPTGGHSGSEHSSSEHPK